MEKDSISGESFVIGQYKYRVEIMNNGRFRVFIYEGDKRPYVIAGDKKTKFESTQLLQQIESVVKQHAPNNAKIKEIVDKYWKPQQWKSKSIRMSKRIPTGGFDD